METKEKTETKIRRVNVVVIDKKILENEKRYVHKLISYIQRDVTININDKNIHQENENIIVTEKSIFSLLGHDEYAYLSVINKDISIQKGKKYSICFKGETEENLNVELCVKGYDYLGVNLEDNKSISLNKKIELEFNAQTKYIKFLVRIKGRGVLRNAQIEVKAIGEWQRPKQNQYIIVDTEDDKEVNVEEYGVDTVCHITHIDPTELYTESNNIYIDSRVEMKNEEKPQYISFYEKNINFGALPELNKIEVSDEYTYYIDFRGQVDIALDAKLFVIVYSQDKKEEVYQIAPNQANTISPSRGSKYMRLALRVEGEGILEIASIHITKKKKVGFIGYKNLRKLGFDVPKSLKDVRMACIFDEFTTECYKYTCDLMPITPDDWKARFTIQKPHFLMVESAWVGNNGAWARKVAYTSENNIKELRELVEWCKANKIPTVFWNKEDPVHYDVFINTAKMFDYIFTTDENKINSYKKDANNENVYALPFAAQPKIHNPIKIMQQRDTRACFAGSYYASKYPERQVDIDRLLDATIETIGIQIYDRYFGKNNKDFLFPERFRPYIKESLKPNQLHIANKGYKVMINVNSVKESPTMFSRRVFEGLACGTPVVSSYSEGINNLFYNIVVASDDKDELVNELNKLHNNQYYYEAKSIIGIREVLSSHTYDKRLEFILNKIKLPIELEVPEIGVLIEVKNTDEFKKAVELLDKQSYINKKLFLLVNNDIDIDVLINNNQRQDIAFINMQYYIENSISLDKILNEPYIAIMNLNNYYAPKYLEDIILAYSYTEAGVIGKASYVTSDNIIVNTNQEYSYVDSMRHDQCVIQEKVYKQYTYDRLIQLLSEENYGLFAQGTRLFSIDKYNYISKENTEITQELVDKITI